MKFIGWWKFTFQFIFEVLERVPSRECGNMKQKRPSVYKSIILKGKADVTNNQKTIGYDLQLKNVSNTSQGIK